jgi:hypothetical protein
MGWYALVFALLGKNVRLLTTSWRLSPKIPGSAPPVVVACKRNVVYTSCRCTTFNASNINEDQDKMLPNTTYVF